MTNEDLYNLILTRARRSGDTTLLAVLPAELRQMLQGWERGPFHPWFLETTSSGLVTVADASVVDLPADFLLLVEDTKVWAIGSDGSRTEMKRAYHEDIENSSVDGAEGTPIDPARPTHFDWFGGELYFFPVPDAIYTIRMKYYAKSTPPANNLTEVDNPWALEAEDLFITEAARRLQAYYVKDQKVIDQLTLDSAKARSELHKYNEARKHNEMDYSVDR